MVSLIQDNITLSKWQKTIPEISAHDKDYGTGKQDIAFTHYSKLILSLLLNC